MSRSSCRKVMLWFVRETELARYYSRIPFEKHPEPSDHLWVPISITEGTTKMPSGAHIVTLPEWFADKNNL